MDQKSIQDTIQAEMNAFLQKPFPAILPKWFLDQFDRVVMEMPQIDVPYRGETIQSILHKSNEQLTLFEVGLVTNILLTVPPKVISTNIDKFLLKKITLEQIRGQWNMLKATEEERLQRKARSFAEANRSRILRN